MSNVTWRPFAAKREGYWTLVMRGPVELTVLGTPLRGPVGLTVLGTPLRGPVGLTVLGTPLLAAGTASNSISNGGLRLPFTSTAVKRNAAASGRVARRTIVMVPSSLPSDL